MQPTWADSIRSLFTPQDPMLRLAAQRDQLKIHLDKCFKERDLLASKFAELQNSLRLRQVEAVTSRNRAADQIAVMLSKTFEAIKAIGMIPVCRDFPIDTPDTPLCDKIKLCLGELNSVIQDTLPQLSLKERGKFREGLEQTLLRLLDAIVASCDPTAQKRASRLRGEWHEFTLIEEHINQRKIQGAMMLESLDAAKRNLHDCFIDATVLPGQESYIQYWFSYASSTPLLKLVEEYKTNNAACDVHCMEYKKWSQKYQGHRLFLQEILKNNATCLEHFNKAVNEESAAMQMMEKERLLSFRHHQNAEDALDRIYHYIRQIVVDAAHFPLEKKYQEAAMDIELITSESGQLDKLVYDVHHLVDQLSKQLHTSIDQQFALFTLTYLQQLAGRLYCSELTNHPVLNTEATFIEQTQWFLFDTNFRQRMLSCSRHALEMLQPHFLALFPQDKPSNEEKGWFKWLVRDTATGYETGPRAIHQLIKKTIEANQEADKARDELYLLINEGFATEEKLKSLGIEILNAENELKNIEEHVQLTRQPVILEIEYNISNDEGQTGYFDAGGTWQGGNFYGLTGGGGTS